MSSPPKPFSWYRNGLLGLVVLVGLLLFGFSFWPQPNSKIDFNAQIRPILNANCVSCHGGVKRNSELSLLFREEALKPAKSGKAAIVAGNPAESELIHRVGHHDLEVRMPPDGKALSEEQIQLLSQWIEEGAEWADHWAYLPPDSSVTPPNLSDAWIRNDIDRFVLDRLDEVGLSPNEAADRATLLRRVSLDLTGLPPTLAEAKAFIADESPEAYEKVVDRLLASPHFGERWAAMWMDLARYGDSQGYQKDPHRNIWRYRDWVIEAFNQDLPFDQFTIDQLAGDLLPEPTEQQLLATAFHRNTMSNSEGGTDDEEFRVAAVLDRVSTTFEIWQGTTMGCVQCHSHPYDPFKHDEFYELFAFFNNTADADRNDEWPTLDLYSGPQEQKAAELAAWIANHDPETFQPLTGSLADQKTQVLQDIIPASSCEPCQEVQVRGTDGGRYLRRFGTRSVARYRGLDFTDTDSLSIQYLGGSQAGTIELRLDRPTGPLIGELSLDPLGLWFGQSMASWAEATAKLASVSGTHDLYLVGKGEEKTSLADVFSLYLHPKNESAQTRELLAQKRTLFEINPGRTPIMQELPPEDSRITHKFERGNWLVHGAVMEPGVPEVLNAFPNTASQDRLGFAQWLVHPDNPLTSRVIVNRFWEQLFGQGLVQTLEDFGTQGEKPSHPEMLDWLAMEFVNAHQWSVKQLLREITLSATYRQASTLSPKKLEKDPANRWLARGPRFRLPAEQIRDQALAVSGLLDKTTYGPSVMPPQPEGVWQVIRNVMRWESASDSDRYRRALYTYWRKSSPYPAMMTFDAPSRELCVSRRIRTNTPLQALATLNDSTFQEASLALALRMQTEGGASPTEQLTHGYQLAMLKAPISPKQQALEDFYVQSLNTYQQHPQEMETLLRNVSTPTPELAALVQVATVILNLDEFINKE